MEIVNIRMEFLDLLEQKGRPETTEIDILL